MDATTVRLASIRIDGGTQSRVEIDEGVASDYAAAYRGGAAFPPPDVFYDGDEYWLADGFHRVAALRLIERDMIGCTVHQGTRRDAVLFSVGANAAHGLRRTNADKRRAVETLLRDPEWSGWSDREIARKAGVDHKTVGRIRSSMGNSPTLDENANDSLVRYVTPEGLVAVQPAQKTCSECGETGHDRRKCPRLVAEDPKPPGPALARAPLSLSSQAEEGTREWVIDTLTDGIAQVRTAIEAARSALTSTGRALKTAEGPRKPVMSSEAKAAYRGALAALKSALSELDAMTPARECAGCVGPGCGDCRGTGWVSVSIDSIAGKSA